MGALRLRNIGGGDFLASLPSGLHDIPLLLQLNELGRTVASLEQQEPMTAKALQRLRQAGSALGGARPKCSVLDGDQPFIAKFTSRLDTQSVELVEVLTLQLAQLCGLRAPTVRLDQSNGLAVALIQRFDRSANGRLLGQAYRPITSSTKRSLRWQSERKGHNQRLSRMTAPVPSLPEIAGLISRLLFHRRNAESS